MRLPRRHRRSALQRIALPGLVGAASVGLIAGGVVLGHRRRRRQPAHGPVRHPWRCECGQEFRVAGLDRHRVYWTADAPESEPLLERICPSCRRPLPAA